MEQQYGDDFISITDEDGKEYELEVLACLLYTSLPDHREDMSDASGSFSAVHVILFCHTEPPCLLWHTGRRRSAA